MLDSKANQEEAISLNDISNDKSISSDSDTELEIKTDEEEMKNTKPQFPVTVDSKGVPRTPSNTKYQNINDIKEESTESKYQDEESEEKEEKNCFCKKFESIITVFKLLNAQLGAGILSVPSTFINTGIIPSIVLLLLIMVLSYACTAIVISLAKEKNTDTLHTLTESILKKPGSILLTILNLVFLNACMVAYLILGGDMITSWFDLGGIDISSRMNHAIMILIYSLCVPVMLTVPRSTKVLDYISNATVASVTYFIVVIFVKFIIFYKNNHYHLNPTCRIWKLDMSIFSSLSIYGLSFALPAVVLPPIKDFNAGLKKRKIVAFFGVFICFLLVVISGFTGYSIFGDLTDGNILKSFDSNDVSIIICRIAFFVIVSCIYPMFSASAMPLWSNIIFHEDRPNENLTNLKRLVIIVVNSIIPVPLAMFLPTAKPIFSIGGAFGGCIVNFIFPCLMYIVNSWSDNKWYYSKYLILYFCILFGAVTCVFSTYQAILDAIDSLKHVSN